MIVMIQNHKFSKKKKPQKEYNLETENEFT